MFVNVFDGNVRPREIVLVTNVFQPGFFRGKTCHPMEVSYGLFDAWQFIDVVYGVYGRGAIGGSGASNMVDCCGGAWNAIEPIKRFVPLLVH